MLALDDLPIEISLAENLFSTKPDQGFPPEAMDNLHSHVITGYEEALSLGMPPLEALSQVLYWVASEVTRVQIPQPHSKSV